VKCFQNLVPGGVAVPSEADPEVARLVPGEIGRGWPPLSDPEREVAVDQADPLDTEVAEQPPEPGSVKLAIAVVDQDLGVRAGPKLGDQGCPFGNNLATALATSAQRGYHVNSDRLRRKCL
jgi:hypothetical protein